MFNFNYMNSQNLGYGYSVSLYDDFKNSWYFIASSIQNFFQTSNANEEIAVGFCLFSLSTGVEVFDEKYWTAWNCSQRKSFGYFLDKIHLISVHSARKNTLVTDFF